MSGLRTEQHERQRRLTLDIDVGAEPLRGVLHDGGSSQPFEGWLALVSALARLVDSAVEPGTGDQGRHRAKAVPGAGKFTPRSDGRSR